MPKKTSEDESHDDGIAGIGRFTHIGNLVEITQGAKNIEKKKNAIKMINYFLSRQNKYPFNSFDDVKMKDWNEDFTGTVSFFLALEARKYCLEDQELISYLTAYGYLSALKMAAIDKEPDAELAKTFEPARFKKFLHAIYVAKAEQARLQGKVRVFSTYMCT